MKKIIRTIGVVILVGIISLFIAAEIFEDKIGLMVQNSINASLKTKFGYETFDLSLVRSFPSASIRFQDISILDISGDSLLTAEKAKIKLRLFSLLKSKIEFVSTEIEGGALNINIDSKGKRNYEIWQKTSDQAGSSELSIEKAKIHNMNVSYNDALNNSNANMRIEDLLISIYFGDDINLQALGGLYSNHVSVGGNSYLVNKSMSINSGLGYDLAKQVLTFQDGEIGVEGIVFYADGSIDFNSDHELYDLVLTNTNGSIEAIFSLLPKNQADSFKKITSSGDFDLSIFYKGKQGKNSNPILQTDLSFSQGRIVIPEIDVPIKNVSFSAKYVDNAKKGLKDAKVRITAFKGSMDGERISGNFSYDNFDSPYIKLDAKGKMPISTLLEVLKIPSSSTDGNVEFKELVINGKLEDLSSPLYQSKTLSKADITLDNISFEIKDQTILLRGGKLQGQADYFELQELEVRTPKSVFVFDGYLKRLVPFLFAEFQRPDLQFDLDVKSPFCDVAEIINLMKYEGGEEPGNPNSFAENTGYVPFMNGDIDISVDKFEHNDITGTDFKGHLSFINNNVGIRGTCKGMKGGFDMEGILRRSVKGSALEAKLICNKIDVHTFFKQTHNFGQKTLTSDHLNGNLYSQLLINADWSPNGDYNSNDLAVIGSVKISSGELIKFQLMDNFSKYIKSEDLSHIRFGSLENYFEIKNEVLYIPAMFIQSNAANLTLSGKHSFDNIIDYNIKVNAGQVLTKKLKRHDPSLSAIPARKKGFFNLYYSVDGSLEDPSYRTAKKQVKSDLESSERQKNIIKQRLNRAFPKSPGLIINTSPSETEDNKMSVENTSTEYLDAIEGKQY